MFTRCLGTLQTGSGLSPAPTPIAQGSIRAPWTTPAAPPPDFTPLYERVADARLTYEEGIELLTAGEEVIIDDIVPALPGLRIIPAETSE